MSENFNKNYQKIVILVTNELEKLDSCIFNCFSDDDIQKTQIIPIIKEFLANKGKQIRPVIIFLFARALGMEVQKFHYEIATTTELIHNATLIHDDIIDCSLLRRGERTLNFNYDSKLAVLAGDFLLARAIQVLNAVESNEIRNLYTQTVSSLINGELFQYFNRFKILSIENYIEKSKNKTAKLFESGVVSTVINSGNVEYVEKARNFALNFGVAFQIHNDLKNINNFEKTCEDIKNGDYSAPIIFYAQDLNLESIKNENKILKDVKASNAINKTQDLIKEYTNKAIENLSFIEDNLYKQALIDLCKLYAGG